MSALITCLFALLALVAIAVAVSYGEYAAKLEKRNDHQAADLTRRDAQIGDMLAHIQGQAADYTALSEACAAKDQRINNLLDLARVHEARIAEQAGSIELARRANEWPAKSSLYSKN